MQRMKMMNLHHGATVMNPVVEMILSDNKGCTIKWFHFTCLRIQQPPKGKWYCPSCRNLPKFNKTKNKVAS